MSKFGRILYAIYPLVLVGTLVFVGAYLINFTTEQSGSDFSQQDAATIHPNQTYIENVTISYENFDPRTIFSIRRENDSIVIVLHSFANTPINWSRVWLPFTIELNESVDASINRSLVGPNGIIKSWAEMSLAAGGGYGVGRPEVTRGGTYRLWVQNMGSEDMHLIISWQVERHFYQKPYLYYGIAVLAIAPVLTAIFLIRKFGPWKSKQQMNEERQ